MATTPHVGQRLLEMTLDELDAAREWMLLLGRKTAREKIASLLSIIARRDASLNLRRAHGQLAFDLPLTREAMADYLGLTLETVSRQMSALKRDGVIEPGGKPARRDPRSRPAARGGRRRLTGTAGGLDRLTGNLAASGSVPGDRLVRARRDRHRPGVFQHVPRRAAEDRLAEARMAVGAPSPPGRRRYPRCGGQVFRDTRQCARARTETSVLTP